MISELKLKNLLAQMDAQAVRRILTKVVWAVLALGLLALVGKLVGVYIPKVETWISEQGAMAPLVYLLIYCLFVSCFVSVDILSFAAGVLFGLWWGFLYAYAGSFLSGALIFVIGRHLIHKRVEKFVGHHPKLSTYDNAISKQGLKIMFLLRLSPLPFAPLSYALTTTRVSFVPYVAACAGMFLTNFVSVYCGFVAQHMGKLTSGHEHLPATHYLGMFAILLLSIVLTVVIARVARKAIAEAS